MNADEFNALYEVGIPVFAYPGARPEDIPSARRLVVRTRSRATVLGGHTAVVWVEDYGSCIALSHVDPVSEEEWKAAKTAEAVADQGALPVPGGSVPPQLAYRVLDGLETVALHTSADQARRHCEFLARREHRGAGRQELFWRLDEDTAHLDHGPEWLVESTAPGFSRLTGFAINPIPMLSEFTAQEA